MLLKPKNDNNPMEIEARVRKLFFADLHVYIFLPKQNKFWVSFLKQLLSQMKIFNTFLKHLYVDSGLLKRSITIVKLLLRFFSWLTSQNICNLDNNLNSGIVRNLIGFMEICNFY